MKTFNLPISDSLLNHAQEIAESENISVEQFIALAISNQVDSWESRKEFERRAKLGDWARAREVLAKAPDVEPEESDKL